MRRRELILGIGAGPAAAWPFAPARAAKGYAGDRLAQRRGLVAADVAAFLTRADDVIE
jgi:hypothetical protein